VQRHQCKTRRILPPTLLWFLLSSWFWNPKALKKVWSANRMQTLCLFYAFPPQITAGGTSTVRSFVPGLNPESTIPNLVCFDGNDGPIFIQFPNMVLSARASIWTSPAQSSQSRGYGPRFSTPSSQNSVPCLWPWIISDNSLSNLKSGTFPSNLSLCSPQMSVGRALGAVSKKRCKAEKVGGSPPAILSIPQSRVSGPALSRALLQ
jgi:hypothetical protein